MHSVSQYRADIDGLRAIAVGSVVLFHLGVSGVPGGFVGVDVFFVISGYLITRIIAEDLDRRRFSLLEFYERRARRILPALFAMMATTSVLASIVMIPPTFRVFGASVVAASLSFSNIYFWLMGGYFAVASSSRPLLHTWSLGVEEQFYLLFPLALMLFRRRSARSWALVVVPLALASLLLALYQVRFDPRAAFYLPFGRFWEMMLGSMLAIGMVPRWQSRLASDVTGWLGLAAIGASVLLFHEGMRFPGEAALLPTLGAALIIHAGAIGATPRPAGSVNRLLAWRPLVFVGLISYSLYLWHWPLIVLAQNFVLQRDLDLTEAALLLLVTLVLSILSWRYVERPFRRRGQAGPLPVLKVAALGSLAFVALGLAAWLTHGWPGRFSPPAQQFALAVEDRNPRRERCDSRPVSDISSGNVCRIGAAGVAPSFAVVGDSFGDAVMPGIEAAAARGGEAGIVLTRSGCNPLFGIRQRDPSCRVFMDAVADLLERSDDIRSVLFVGRWTRIAEGTRFGIREMADAFIMDDQSKTASRAENRRVFARSIERMAAMLPDKKIFVTAFFPEQTVHVPQAAFIETLMGRTPDLGVDRAVFEKRQHYVREVLMQASEELGIQVLDIGAFLCDVRRCRAVEDGRALYFDDNHLTRTAALRYSGVFDPVFVE